MSITNENAATSCCNSGDGSTSPTTLKEAGASVFSMPIPSSTPVKEALPRVDGRPCPAWCQVGDGHPWECLTADGRVMRFHVRYVSADDDFAAVSVTAEETATAWPCDHFDLLREDPVRQVCECDIVAAGPSTMSTPMVSVDGVRDDLTADEASQLAVWLRRAAIAVQSYRAEADK